MIPFSIINVDYVSFSVLKDIFFFIRKKKILSDIIRKALQVELLHTANR